jgi:methionyl aminopeptidase
MVKCSTDGCDAKAGMRCPTCIKLNIDKGSYFCNQECFKANWDSHKKLHKLAKLAMERTTSVLAESTKMTYAGFEFTGPMRPYKQSPRRPIPPHIVQPDYGLHPAGRPDSEIEGRQSLRVLSPQEIEKMRHVCKLGREVLDACARVVKPGATTDEIDAACHAACLERNCYPSPLNYYQFPKSCCTSVNEVICHGIPDGYPLQEGDIVNVDVSVYHNGYHADLNETFLVGEVDKQTHHLVKTTHECLMKAIEKCKPGMRYRDIGDIITKHAESQGFSVVRTYCGHGINNLFHCAPNVPHYSKNKAIGVLKPGHTFTIEPMINVGTWHDVTWPDNWTSTTRDGKRSAQFEHTLLVTETGVEILTARTADTPGGSIWFEDAQPGSADAPPTQ